MNRLFIIILATFFISCNDVAEKKGTYLLPDNSKALKVQLLDSLGIINFSVPPRYDTSFSWIHYSDCGKPCDEQKYRFQPKELFLLKESGWIWTEPKDSIDRFTISHTLDYPFHDGDTAKNIVRHNHLKEQLKSNPQNPPINFDTIQKINDRYFSIITMEKSDTVQVKKVLAVTTIKSNLIKFQY
ncbi:MAG: hypothetical protein ACOYLO_18730, partial [Ferruginibacter sp.]